MNLLSTGLRLDFLSQQISSRFHLSTGDDLGSVPIQLKAHVVGFWSRNPDHYGDQIKTSLRMIRPGVRRVRLYCDEQAAKSARLIVHGGEPAPLGRRQAPLTEVLTWTNSQNRSLKYAYDHPNVRIIDKTPFYDENGQEQSPPGYIPHLGAFYHPQPVTGALVVEYSPAFSLFEVTYTLGEEQMEAARFKEMQLAWLAGNIRDCDIPAVHLIALADGQATQLSFQRQFWPEGADGKGGHAGDAIPSLTDLIPLIEELDPCWKNCWQQLTGGEKNLTTSQYLAIISCVESASAPAPVQYVEIDRQSQVERIFSPDSEALFVDVERAVTLTMKRQRADGKTGCNQQALYSDLPEITFRFNQ
ncbi:MAG: hypothetical protein HQL67_10330 [Magnetococcales bacterium]|nr:hypothetical protein [Magnetococcales bacterium]